MEEKERVDYTCSRGKKTHNVMPFQGMIVLIAVIRFLPSARLNTQVLQQRQVLRVY